MRCSIARPPGTFDSFGQQQPPQTVASDVPCYWWALDTWADQRGSSPAMANISVEHLLVALGTDIRPGDWVTEVTDHRGRTVFAASEYRVVEHPSIRRNHIDCTLKYGLSLEGR